MTNILLRPTISSAGALTAMNAAVAQASTMDVPVCVSVADVSGTLVAFVRMDGAPAMSIQIAQDKAFTVTSFGLATSEWYPLIKDEPSMLHGIVKTDRLTIFGGGVPIIIGDQIVGAVGVSGGTCDEDVRIATAGAAAVG